MFFVYSPFPIKSKLFYLSDKRLLQSAKIKRNGFLRFKSEMMQKNRSA
jgi:hypothetical protein